jgi:hypothetical protein
MMIVAIQLVALPGVFLFWIWWLYATGERKRIVAGLLCFVLSFTAGLWPIARSTSASQAGLLLLPYISTASGLLGLAFGYGWASKRTGGRIAGRVCLTAAALLIGAQVLAAR